MLKEHFDEEMNEDTEEDISEGICQRHWGRYFWWGLSLWRRNEWSLWGGICQRHWGRNFWWGLLKKWLMYLGICINVRILSNS